MRLFVPFIAAGLMSLPAIAQTEKPGHSHSGNDSTKRINLHFQTTYIYQYKARMHSPYSGPNSLSGEEERQNSLTATMYLGIRLWKGAAFYVNPEIAGGSGLSGALGMGGSTNGETFRVGDPAPTLYLGRGYLEQTFALKGGNEYVADDANQVPRWLPKNYIRFTVGKYSLGDLFDNNDCSNSPRTQFLNWSLMNNGAWDYAANVRGYTYAFTAELQQEAMNYKIALAALPKVANGPDLNTNPNEAYGLNAEVTRSYTINRKPGHVRLLGYYNYGNMGNYKNALSNTAPTDTPDITADRKTGRSKTGFGLNADQQLNDYLSVFGRLGWNDGKNETWAFTEIDRTLSLGLSLNGKKWHRADDVIGLAFVGNGLSKDHQDYLKAGGSGFILGDGTLNYAPEMIGEIYYSYKPAALPIWLTADYQLGLNPGCNKDRGPANVVSVRVHVEL